MTVDKAIETIEYASAFNSDNSPLTKALGIAIEALKGKKERESNQPLTIEELREIHKKDTPIYVKFSGGVYSAILDRYEDNLVAVWCAAKYPEYLYEVNYGKTWIAYKYKPDE